MYQFALIVQRGCLRSNKLDDVTDGLTGSFVLSGGQKREQRETIGPYVHLLGQTEMPPQK